MSGERNIRLFPGRSIHTRVAVPGRDLDRYLGRHLIYVSREVPQVRSLVSVRCNIALMPS